MRIASITALSCAFLIASAAAGAQGAENGYTFFTDGKQFEPELAALDGDPSDISEGDVILVPANGASGVFILLGPPGEYRFRDRVRDEGILFLEGPEGPEYVVAAATRRFGSKTIDPMSNLSESDVSRLRGLNLCAKTDAAAAKIAHVDPAKCLVEIVWWAALGDRTQDLPDLPANLAYLRIDNIAKPCIEDLSGLKVLTKLKFLWIRSANFNGIDMSNLEGMSGLMHLSFRHHSAVDKPPQNAHLLGQLRDLRHLCISSAQGGIDDIAFCSDLPKLRFLDVQESRVSDLSVLGGHPSLISVIACKTKASKMPGAMPRLKRMDVRQAEVLPEEIAAFKEANPKTEVLWTRPPEPAGIAQGWMDSLKNAMRGADRLVISDVMRKGVVREESNPEALAELVAAIEIDDRSTRGGMEAESLGELRLDFYKGEKPLGSVILLSFAAVARWPKGQWNGDAVLTEKGAKQVGSWMAARGVGAVIGGKWRYFRRR